MGLFDAFRSKRKSRDSEVILIGYLTVKNCELLGLDLKSQEFAKAQESAAKIIEESFVLMLNKDAQQAVFDTIETVCRKRSTEAYGAYLMLLFTRFSVIQHAIQARKVKPEEATLDILNRALHDQVKHFITQI